MTATEVPGLLDINAMVWLHDDMGSQVKRVSGCYLLSQFFHLKDKSTLIAAVHQAAPISAVLVVHPNTPEMETIGLSIAKTSCGLSSIFPV